MAGENTAQAVAEQSISPEANVYRTLRINLPQKRSASLSKLWRKLSEQNRAKIKTDKFQINNNKNQVGFQVSWKIIWRKEFSARGKGDKSQRDA